MDEVPWWISEQGPVFGGALQTAWDRALSSKPVLLLLLGSDMRAKTPVWPCSACRSGR
ncbi:hypothetical protein [Glycomyces tenuis]|uniref:hypothetical protein n=1 Tax=Glycomyces tenuis TaxID=58116 RepID=UPI00040C7611|nr:hypothetical protein [Glycomyces tenuis]